MSFSCYGSPIEFRFVATVISNCILIIVLSFLLFVIRSIMDGTSEQSGGASGGTNSDDQAKEEILTRKSLCLVEQHVKMNMIQHKLAWKHLAARQFWYFTVPQAFFTLMASVLAFVSNSELVDSTVGTGVMTTIVGSLSGFVIFLQTMNGVCNYGTRAAMHDIVSMDLREMRDDLVLLRYKLDQRSDLSEKNGNDDNGFKVDKLNPRQVETFHSIETRFHQSLTGCKSTIPLPLSEAFEGVNSYIKISKTERNDKDLVRLFGGERDFEHSMYFKAYDYLSEEISNYGLNCFPIRFPLRLPNSSKSSSRAMARLKEHIGRVDGYWGLDEDNVRIGDIRPTVVRSASGTPYFGRKKKEGESAGAAAVGDV